MSTRAQIVCADRNGKLALPKIYKHCDGYPSAVLPTLTTFSQEFCKGRGDDPEYMLAQAVRYFALAANRITWAHTIRQKRRTTQRAQGKRDATRPNVATRAGRRFWRA